MGLSALGRSFLAGQLAHLRELTLLFAPNINSYKRYVEGSFAPTAVKWGRDNRTCALRLVGHGAGPAAGEPGPRRRRQPVPRASPAMVAAGLDGIEQRPGAGAGRSPATRTPPTPSACPTRCERAARLWTESAWARQTFGDEVVDHYANMARVELAAFGAAVTDWERFRGFERL